MLFYNLNYLSRIFIIVGTNIFYLKIKDISKCHVLYNKNYHNAIIFNVFLNFNEIMHIF